VVNLLSDQETRIIELYKTKSQLEFDIAMAEMTIDELRIEVLQKEHRIKRIEREMGF
jgi:uncharacterized coiled-coil protein SlyX